MLKLNDIKGELLLRKTFLENPKNPSILLRLPMTKAAVRAVRNY